jgi:uncharacterized Zn finger protein (UPF0148 family)
MAEEAARREVPTSHSCPECGTPYAENRDGVRRCPFDGILSDDELL